MQTCLLYCNIIIIYWVRYPLIYAGTRNSALNLVMKLRLDHVLSSMSSCIVVMVHMVKGRQYSACTVPHAGASIMSETDSRPR
jgi:hypothetical protein